MAPVWVWCLGEPRPQDHPRTPAAALTPHPPPSTFIIPPSTPPHTTPIIIPPTPPHTSPFTLLPLPLLPPLPSSYLPSTFHIPLFNLPQSSSLSSTSSQLATSPHPSSLSPSSPFLSILLPSPLTPHSTISPQLVNCPPPLLLSCPPPLSPPHLPLPYPLTSSLLHLNLPILPSHLPPSLLYTCLDVSKTTLFPLYFLALSPFPSFVSTSIHPTLLISPTSISCSSLSSIFFFPFCCFY